MGSIAGPARVAGALLGGVVVAATAGAALGTAMLAGVARAWVGMLGGDGAAASIGGWSLTAAYAVIGLAAGGAIGATLGLARALRRVEASLRPALEAQCARLATERALGPGRSPAELRQRWEQLTDEAVARSVGAVRVPGAGLVARAVRSRLRHAPVEDFLAACERDGVRDVGPAEIGRWLAAQGPSYLLAPVRVQLRTWRLAATAVAVLAAAAPAVVLLSR